MAQWCRSSMQIMSFILRFHYYHLMEGHRECGALSSPNDRNWWPAVIYSNFATPFAFAGFHILQRDGDGWLRWDKMMQCSEKMPVGPSTSAAWIQRSLVGMPLGMLASASHHFQHIIHNRVISQPTTFIQFKIIIKNLIKLRTIVIKNMSKRDNLSQIKPSNIKHTSSGVSLEYVCGLNSANIKYNK